MNNIPLNGWPQIKDLPELQHRVERIAKIEAWKADTSYIEETGSSIEIDNCLGVPANKLTATLAPTQSLNGYTKPWAGGAGKNKLPLVLADIKAANTSGTWSDNEYTFRGVTWTITTDNADNITGVKANGTADGGSSELNFGLFNLVESTSYIATDGTTDSGSNFNLRIGDHDNAYVANTGNGTVTFTADSANTARLSVTSGYTISNKLFLPMIRLAAETDATFEPYSNICPITGITTATVQTTDGETTNEASMALGETVYAGSVDFNAGTGESTHKSVTVTAFSGKDGSTHNNYYFSVSDAKLPSANTDITNVSSNMFVSGYSYEQMYRADTGGVSITTSGLCVVSFGANSEINTLALANAWLAENSLQVVYELATPETLTLTPDTLTMLRGSNTVITNCDTITIKALTGRTF